jgi:hypothetical protein
MRGWSGYSGALHLGRRLTVGCRASAAPAPSTRAPNLTASERGVEFVLEQLEVAASRSNGSHGADSAYPGPHASACSVADRP